LFKYGIFAVLAVALVAWTGNPRACCPHDSVSSDGLFMSEMCGGATHGSCETSPVSHIEMGDCTEPVIQTSDPMPRSGAIASDAMPLSSACCLVSAAFDITQTEIITQDVKPLSTFPPPPKHPPRYLYSALWV
jgi:hypothetical protein